MRKSEKFTAMISSTARDLPDHRPMVMDACLRMGLRPIMMEHLAGQERSAADVSTGMVEEAQVYLGVFAHCYGSCPDDDSRSYTEIEFDKAVSLGIPVIPFFMHDDHPWRASLVDKSEKAAKLERLKQKVAKGRIVNWFKSPEDLRGLVVHALSEFQKQQKAAGDKPAAPDFHPPNIIPKPPEPYIAHPYSLLQTKDVVGRQAELNLLTDWVTTNRLVPADTRIFNLVAIGGMGKSALTWKWFNDIAPNELPKLAGRMWWSFYESDAHWENFIIRALASVSGQSEKTVREMKSPDREDQLWRILDQQPFLLVLDGLERILLAYARMDAAQMLDDDLDQQTANAIAEAHGLPDNVKETYLEKHRLRQCIDSSAGRFLRRLATVRASRILVSTRLYPAELQTNAAQPWRGCFALFLIGLKDDDAINLWREFGVTGSREQLLKLFNAFGNYPLLIRALAGEIAEYKPAPGDFDRWIAKNLDFNPGQLDLKNAKSHVLKYALQGLRDEQRKVLHTIAAFRMPATWETLRALLVNADRAGCPQPAAARDHAERRGEDTAPYQPAAEGATAKPCADDRALDAILTELEDRGLVGWNKKANRYDLHPIVRGVVWRSLDKASRTGIHTVLFSHFDAVPKPSSWRKVESIDDLATTIESFTALIGLERFDDAMSLFRSFLDHATFFRLSALNWRTELLQPFFPYGLGKDPELTAQNDRSFVLNALGLAYQYCGQPLAAVPFFERSNHIDQEEGNLQELAIGLTNLSACSRFIGHFRKADIYGHNALALNRKTKQNAWEVVTLYRLGTALSMMGRLDEAKTALTRGEAMARKHDSSHLTGKIYTRWSRLLLLSGHPKEAVLAARKAWELANHLRQKRDFIRAKRSEGEAELAVGNLSGSMECLQTSLNDSRTVGYVEEELPVLTALAELHRQQKKHLGASELLNQVWDAAERGPYPLFHADARNVLAQIERDKGNREAAIAAATKAYTLAWCDGISADGKVCYAYHYGLTNARKHLQELGAPEPQLPPFDESKFEPMPDVELNPKDEFWVDPAKLDSP